MGDVSVGHKKALVPDSGDTTAVGRSPVKSHKLSENIVVTDFETRGLTRILEILRRCANRTVAFESIPNTNPGAAPKTAKWPDLAIVADLNRSLDDRIGSDDRTVGDLRFWIDNRGGVDFRTHQRSARADIISASHTTSSSTSARPLILANALRLATNSTSKMI